MENIREYLDYDGLKEYHEKLKTQISEEIGKVENKIQSISVDDDREVLIIK